MSTLSAPRIAGVAGGVGTTTLATALRAYDRGREGARGVDVLACRATGQSLHQAATVVAWLADNGRPRPVLAVTSDQPGQLPNTARARLRMMEPRLAAVVVLPYVGHWREMSDPLTEAAMLSEFPAGELPRPLRSYGRTLATLTELVLRSGLLGGPQTGDTPSLGRPGPRTGATPAVTTAAFGTPAGGGSRGGSPAGGSPVAGSPATGNPATGNPATASGEFLSVPLSRFAAYGGAL